MTQKENIESLEKKLMGTGYEPSKELMPGYVKPLLMKGEVGVHLGEVTSSEAYFVDKCLMQIHVPSRNSESRTPSMHGYGLLFTTQECGGMWWYVRKFPYAEVPTCLAGRKHLSDYVLPISDEEAATKIIEREVEFTQKMIEDVDREALLEKPAPSGHS